MANKLVKVNDSTYVCEGYELKKETVRHYNRLHKVWKLFNNGKYVGQPETVADANKWINR